MKLRVSVLWGLIKKILTAFIWLGARFRDIEFSKLRLHALRSSVGTRGIRTYKPQWLSGQGDQLRRSRYQVRFLLKPIFFSLRKKFNTYTEKKNWGSTQERLSRYNRARKYLWRDARSAVWWIFFQTEGWVTLKAYMRYVYGCM